jgi:hypothetical protein
MLNEFCKLPGSSTKVADKPSSRFRDQHPARKDEPSGLWGLTSRDVPLDMAVEEVNAGIVGLEAEGEEASGKDGDGITAQWAVALGLELLPLIIAIAWAVSVNDLEGVAVKM